MRDLLTAGEQPKKAKGKKNQKKAQRAKKSEHFKTGRALREKFVFLNVYCASVKDEHDPRGPEGPYQFTDRSVPVIVIKKFDGESLKHQLGWGGGVERLAQIVDRAVAANGPIAPPKALRPMLKSYAKAQKALARKQPRNAIRELQKVIKAGQNTKKFADGPPEVATKAKADLDKLQKQALDELAVLKAKAEVIGQPVKTTKAALNRLLSKYGGIAEVKARVKAVVAELGKKTDHH